MSDEARVTRREADAADLVAALERFIATRPSADFHQRAEARRNLIAAIVRATGNPEPE